MLNFIYNKRRKRKMDAVTTAVLLSMIDDLSSEIYLLVEQLDEIREDLDFVLYEIESELEH